ncbi:MAG: prolyl aminopeptidase [Candidatus Marinimicrobia bacterium]|nr:prolyl aminopeptidase [Candidatus Neomarinimicrobiota bacterium]MBL7022459.1 prolyl aminopeptidase [Candidatus Neomarinimicrobiota bacterium]MBL7108686.1 prolyl aminopeptidase [Candidatus Neomarinimicrobiota bacterium]
MKDLYPNIEPFNEFQLNVSDLHTIHIEESGNPKGKPVIFLHGGPGGGIEPVYRQYFNPEKWRIIIFDQRGCGKSTPHAELQENTTWDLVEDIEKIRDYISIDQWVVFGGSWGSTLALSYAIKHQNRCKGLIFRGIFMLREKEIRWFYQEGASYIYPDAWEKYLEPIPKFKRNNLVKSYYEQLTDENINIRLKAAKAWSIWEASTSKLFQSEKSLHHFEIDDIADAFARIECHYFINKGFFKTDEWLLENINSIRQIPAVIVQGRYDVVCPMQSAWDLHRKWPEADFHIIQDAGHSMTEPGIRSKLIEYTDKFVEL